MPIKAIGADALDEMMALFVHCFVRDHYYMTLFPHERERIRQLRDSFAVSVAYCMAQQGAFGIYQDGALIAFVLVFDYLEAKRADAAAFRRIFAGDGNKDLPYKEQLHNKIETLGESVVYLLSIGVHESCRGRGYASRLIDFILKSYPNDWLVSDVSNAQSLSMYDKRGFLIEDIDEEYFFIKRAPGINMNSLVFEDTLLLALPDAALAREIPGLRPEDLTALTLEGYVPAPGGTYRCFLKRPAQSGEAFAARVSYAQLLCYQRYINLACQREVCFLLEGGEACLLYYQEAPGGEGRLWNQELADMIVTRESEWAIVPDIHIQVPVEYTDLRAIKERERHYSNSMGAFLRFLDYRTHYEAGIPKCLGNKDDFSFKNRIRRYYLGQLQVQITQESTVDTYNQLGEAIGAPALVDMILSLDVRSECGVLALVSQSAPFLLSHLLDNVIRNQLFVLDRRQVWTNLYDYLYSEFGLIKRGSAKSFVTIPKTRDCLAPAQIASVLLSETIYASDEEFGKIIDPEIVGIVASASGMGQYDRAYVCVHTNVFIQFCEGLRASVNVRLYEEAITCFYIELLLFEEAAIQIADYRIVAFLSGHRRISTGKFLRETLSIHRRYTKTIEFWDIQVNYPSSRISMAMIRGAFKIDDQIAQMKRNSDALGIVFDTQRDIMDRTEATLLNYILLFLAVIEGVSIVMAAAFQDSGQAMGSEVVGASVLTLILIMILFHIVKRYIGRTKE